MTLRERIAEKEHEQWIHWMDYMFDNLTLDKINNWQRLMKTPYNQLTEEEKESDRVWADIVLALSITVDCRKCRGSGKYINEGTSKGSLPYPDKCPHCTDGQWVIMKVKTCKAYVKNSPCKEDCETNGFSAYSECKITEPLTLADIDFTGEIRLKRGWRVEVL